MTTKAKRTITLVSLIVLFMASAAICAPKEGERKRGQDPERDRPRPRTEQGWQERREYGNREHGPRGQRMGGQMEQRGRGFGEGPMGQQAGEQMHGMMLKKLNLTDDQQQQLKEIHKGQAGKTDRLNKKLADLKKQLYDAVIDGDTESIPSIAQKMGKAIGDTAILKVRSHQKFIKILDDEQLKQLTQLQKGQKERAEKFKAMKAKKDGDHEDSDDDDDDEKKSRKDRKPRAERGEKRERQPRQRDNK